jgi:hypothetical protein
LLQAEALRQSILKKAFRGEFVKKNVENPFEATVAKFTTVQIKEK